MQSPPLYALEVVVGLVAVGWGVWELLSLRRGRARDRCDADASRRRAASERPTDRAEPPS